MDNKVIDELTNQLIQKERFFSFYIWKTAQEYGYTMNTQEIEDILSDSYLRAATKIQNNRALRLRYPLAWFTRVIFLTLMNFLRKRQHKIKGINIQELDNVRATNFVYETIDNHINNDIIKKIIDKHLTDDEKTVIQMNVDGYTYEEISNVLGKTEESVRQIKSRAVKKIKKKIS
jgi:RNA polymerase sigma factor (sigma-70 family)